MPISPFCGVNCYEYEVLHYTWPLIFQTAAIFTGGPVCLEHSNQFGISFAQLSQRFFVFFSCWISYFLPLISLCTSLFINFLIFVKLTFQCLVKKGEWEIKYFLFCMSKIKLDSQVRYRIVSWKSFSFRYLKALYSFLLPVLLLKNPRLLLVLQFLYTFYSILFLFHFALFIFLFGRVFFSCDHFSNFCDIH